MHFSAAITWLLLIMTAKPLTALAPAFGRPVSGQFNATAADRC